MSVGIEPGTIGFDANTPNHYTTETDCGNVGKVFNLMPFA